jgi:hypothetical protein
VYWISIAAQYDSNALEVTYPWGWKTRQHFWNDDAVRIFVPTAPAEGDFYREGQPIVHGDGLTWDMAFVLTTPTYDFGDAPDAPGAPAYRTRLVNDGARHAIVSSGPIMGPLIDAEPDGLPDPDALGDDNHNMDDEDGVTFLTPLVPGEQASAGIDMTSSPSDCLLNAWIDFNYNGDWLDSGEQIAANEPMTAGLDVTLTFTVPPVPASTTGPSFARFRCSTQPDLLPTGLAWDGEVEDYAVQIIAPPQPPNVAIATSGTTDVHLSWPHVTLDIYGHPIDVVKYWLYRRTEPYFMPTAPAHTVLGPFPGVVDHVFPGDIGDPSNNYYYVVIAVAEDMYLHDVPSDKSNRVGEFDFALVPGD